MVLRDAAGLVVDSLNYGLLVDPWAAEGYQAASGAGQSGCRVPAPAIGTSAGRFPDGADTDSNCADFLTQAIATLSAASAAGGTNIKVASVAGFDAGQTITIDTGANLETAVIATVGTPGATTMDAATEMGATAIPVAGAFGFIPARPSRSAAARTLRRRLSSPLPAEAAPRLPWLRRSSCAHAAGAEVSGTGITLASCVDPGACRRGAGRR